MTETDLADWLTVPDAAAILRCSRRTVERLKQAGTLEQRLRPQAGSPAVAVYNPEDVARIALERHPAPAPFVVPAVQTPANGNGNGGGLTYSNRTAEPRSNKLATNDPIHQFFAYLLHTLQSPPSPPVAETVAETLFLTITDAAAVSGLPAADIRRACESGELKARKTGRGGWRIRRTDLEAL